MLVKLGHVLKEDELMWKILEGLVFKIPQIGQKRKK